MAETVDCEILIIGSGPSGATAASMLAAAGHDVLLAEEGAHHAIESAPSYTRAEMDQKYRNGGLNTTFGKSSVTYIEGRCVGGASEINAALWHRPLPRVLRAWALKNQIDDFSQDTLEEHFTILERDLSVSTRPDGLSPASDVLEAGAEMLGWKSTEIPRCWKYEKHPDGTWSGRRQSMSETLIPRALNAGCRLSPGTRIDRLTITDGRATEAVGTRDGAPVRIRFQRVIVCAGAVQTPLILRRSGIRERIGDSLQMHPMIRIAARFPDEVNDPVWGVPVRQVEEFKPHLTLGCSHSSIPHLSMWLGGAMRQAELLSQWRRLAVFYVAAVGQGTGKIRNLPVFHQPLIQYDLNDADLALLGEGLYRLGQLLFAAGAVELFSPIEGDRRPIRDLQSLRRIRSGLPHGKLSISTIHLFSSCPMGEDRRTCAVDSYGRLHDHDNVYVFDASILPASPGVNPQSVIMAVARRNAAKLIAEL
ncbi:MAG: GMC family oxidoreductase [Myxococcota bacterium]